MSTTRNDDRSAQNAGHNRTEPDIGDWGTGLPDDAHDDRNNHGSHGSHAETPLTDSMRDPLLTRPRWSAVAWSAVLGLLLVLAAAALWWVSVRTLAGQSLDTLVWQHLRSRAPGWLRVVTPVITSRYVVDAFVVLCGVIAAVTVLARRRFGLVVQMIVFTLVAVLAHLSKYVLPRPVLDKHLPNPANTSPSGHTMAIATAVILLLMACGLAWRAWVALFAALAAFVGPAGLILGRWHRPSDVIVGLLLTGGLALITLAFTRGSAMDRPGTRRSSPAIQIVSAILIVAGLASGAYAVYLLVQLWPGLSITAAWIIAPTCRAALAAIISADCLVIGLVLACRQATASPLSTLGLLGGPPKPAKKERTDSRGGQERRTRRSEHAL